MKKTAAVLISVLLLSCNVKVTEKRSELTINEVDTIVGAPSLSADEVSAETVYLDAKEAYYGKWYSLAIDSQTGDTIFNIETRLIEISKDSFSDSGFSEEVATTSNQRMENGDFYFTCNDAPVVSKNVKVHLMNHRLALISYMFSPSNRYDILITNDINGYRTDVREFGEEE